MIEGRFFVVSAPSGTGKTTLVQRLLAEVPGLTRSISCTTRPLRAGEKSDRDYHFIPEQEFRQKVEEGAFFEWEEVHGHLYGTPQAPLLANRREGKDTVLDIDVRGALNLKKAYPDSCLIFLLPPSMEALETRLKNRNTEGEGALKRRLEGAKREMTLRDRFDFVIVNDELDRAYAELKSIVMRER